MPTRVLIVDDHVLILESLRRVLNTRPDTVVVGEAADGAGALAKAAGAQPDIVIVDLGLPDTGGIDLIHRLKAVVPLARYIVMTGHTERHYANEAIAAGVSGFLRKTNGPAEILLALEAAVRGEIYLCTATTTALLQPSLAGPSPADVKIPDREREVLQLVVKGLRNKEIAQELGISVKTVETHRSRLMTRTGSQSPAELVRFAIRNGLSDP